MLPELQKNPEILAQLKAEQDRVIDRHGDSITCVALYAPQSCAAGRIPALPIAGIIWMRDIKHLPIGSLFLSGGLAYRYRAASILRRYQAVIECMCLALQMMCLRTCHTPTPLSRKSCACMALWTACGDRPWKTSLSRVTAFAR